MFADGTLKVVSNNDDGLYGATVKLRESKAISGDPYTIMIDTQHALPAGVLQYFYVFIEQTYPSAAASYLRLQIWRRADVPTKFQLVWQRPVYLNDSSPQALYTVNIVKYYRLLSVVLALFLSQLNLMMR